MTLDNPVQSCGDKPVGVGGQFFCRILDPLTDFSRKIRRTPCGDQFDMAPRQFAEIREHRACVRNGDTDLAKTVSEMIERGLHARRGRAQRMIVDDEHAKALQILMPGGRQRQFVADSLRRLVGSGDDIELQGEIGGAARHRPRDREPTADRYVRHMRRPGAVHRHKIEARLVREDAAEMRRAAQ